MSLLTKIEDIISIPMELFHTRRGFHPVDINRLAVRCMEQGSRKGIKKVYAPNRFRVLLNPIDYNELYPFLDMIRSEITGELRLMAAERKFLLAGDLDVEIIESPDTPEGLPQVTARMQGRKEPASVVSMNEETGRQETPSPSPARDAETVILLSEPASGPEKTLLDGISSLKQGKPDIAYEKLSDSGDALDASPRFHAAMAVALEMMGRPDQALDHYRRIEAIDGPNPVVRRRIAWLENPAAPAHGTDKITTALGRLETGIPGVVLHLATGGIYLENRNMDDSVRLNGEVVQGGVLKDGSKVQIGDLELTFRSVTEIRS